MHGPEQGVLTAAVAKVVELVVAPEVGEIVVEPAPSGVGKPWLPVGLLIVATPGFEEAHVTELVRSGALPSELVPVALNCWVALEAMDGFAGEIASETSTGLTLSEVDPVIVPQLAAMVVDPDPTAVTRPLPVIVATFGALELQITLLVRFCVLPSLFCPVAVYCWLVPTPTVAAAGATEIETSEAFTVKVVKLWIDPTVALIEVAPTTSALANPLLPTALLTVATLVLEELQLTDCVRS